MDKQPPAGTGAVAAPRGDDPDLLVEVSYRVSEARGDAFIPGKPRPFSEIRVAVPQGGGFTSYDVAPDGRLAVVVPADEQVEKPQTALRVVLNLGDELQRRAPVAK